MGSSRPSLEIEIKLTVKSVEEARARLARLPADSREERRFEDNEIFDTPDRRLTRADALLRLRVVGQRGVITFKEKVESDLRAKVRREIETDVDSPASMRAILERLGLVRIYRYQKYRSYHAWIDPASDQGLTISLDDTPIGVFLELEGPPEAIDRAAAMMGFGPDDYVLDDYRTLHLAWLQERGLPESDLVFPGAP